MSYKGSRFSAGSERQVSGGGRKTEKLKIWPVAHVLYGFQNFAGISEFQNFSFPGSTTTRGRRRAWGRPRGPERRQRVPTPGRFGAGMARAPGWAAVGRGGCSGPRFGIGMAKAPGWVAVGRACGDRGRSASISAGGRPLRWVAIG